MWKCRRKKITEEKKNSEQSGYLQNARTERLPMDGIEAGGSGALLIVAQPPRVLYIQNRCAAAVVD